MYDHLTDTLRTNAQHRNVQGVSMVDQPRSFHLTQCVCSVYILRGMAITLQCHFVYIH